MGTIKNGANGGFSGKAGSVVGSRWKKIDYIKGLSKDRTKPASQAQLEQQAKFAAMVRFLQPINDILSITFGHMKEGRCTGFNVALKLNMKTVQGTYPNYTIDYGKVVIAGGVLQPAVGSVTTDADGNLHLSWSPQTNPRNAYANDQLTVLVYDPETNIFIDGPQNIARADGEVTISMRPEMAGRAVHVFYFFTSLEGKKTSPSWYAGAGTAAS
jgi:hypothetical protein